MEKAFCDKGYSDTKYVKKNQRELKNNSLCSFPMCTLK